MKAWVIDAYSGIGSAHLDEVDRPTPGYGQVVVKVRIAALNPADRYLAEAQYPARPTFPHILGRECLGTIAELGPGVSGWQVGQRVLLLHGDIGADRWGTFAEYVLVEAQLLVHPPLWTDEQLAGSTLVYLTAWQALNQWGTLPPCHVLVTGASGGVGSAGVQLASTLGHRVIALTRTDSKADALRAWGASIVLNCSRKTWVRELKDTLDKDRVDLAIDNIGGELLTQVIETLGMHAKVSCVGRLAGPVPQFNTATLFFRRLRLGGVAIDHEPPKLQQAWREIVDLMQHAGKRPIVDHVFPMEDLPQAFARLAQGPTGKVLLRVVPPA